MNKLILFLSVIIFYSFNTFSQENINDYKYIVIPSEFGFLSQPDQYQLNSLTKFLFNKYGYTALIKTENYPEDLSVNRCLALYADVIKEKGGIFKTKIKIDLKNCDDKVIMSSKIGETKEKEFAKAYNLALRDAFETYQTLNYKYEPNANILAKSSISKTENAVDKKFEESKAEVERLQKEIEELKEAKEVAKTDPEIALKEEVKKEVVAQVSPKMTSDPSENLEVLYAQPIENGFQIVDSTPKVVMIILETTKQNVFIVKDENAIVYEEDGFWYYSKNDGSAVSIKTLNIKF